MSSTSSSVSSVLSAASQPNALLASAGASASWPVTRHAWFFRGAMLVAYGVSSLATVRLGAPVAIQQLRSRCTAYLPQMRSR